MTSATPTPSTPPPPVTFELLIVEDDLADVDLTREALEIAGPLEFPIRINAVRDGDEAMLFLRRQGPFETAPRPHLVLLDLNMPRKSGHEVLREIKSDEALRGIPVIVLTTSDASEDIEKSYEYGANSFITKARDFSDHLEIVKTIKEFWLRVATLPIE